MLWEICKWCEASFVGTAVRESTWLFPIVECVHLAALAVIGGAVLIVDMRLLGVGLQSQPVRRIAREAQPFVIASLCVMVVSGLVLFASEATKCYESVAFQIKIAALILVSIFTFTVKRTIITVPDGQMTPFTGRLVAVASVSLWSAVGWGGRWIGFGG